MHKIHKIFRTETRTTSKPTSTFKNNQLDWHSLKKVVNCQICNKPSGNSIVSHYVNDHPDSEVLVSRLAVECLRSGNNITKCKVIRK